jgi:Transposase DDE domain
VRRRPPAPPVPDPRHRHHGQAGFGPACQGCPLRGQCTTSPRGRSVTITPYEHELAQARTRHADPGRAADYRATRPKVERRLAHLVRRRHGGRRVRVRGLAKVAADLNCWPPRSTWPAWACSACTGSQPKAGPPHDPAGASISGTVAPAYQRRPSLPGQPTPR